jgi:zinc/manganese transport system substrate-binding protein
MHPMKIRRRTLMALTGGMALLLLTGGPACAQGPAQPLPVVASFSVLGDVVAQVGGDRIALSVIVAPGSDAHVVQPTPAQARQVAAARVVVSHGLGLEGWLPRLEKAAGFRGKALRVAQGLPALKPAAGKGHGHHHHHDVDPHTWQDVARVRLWLPRIADALCGADAAGCDGYRARATAYDQRLAALDAEIRSAWEAVPAAERKLITSHDAFGYYAAAYGVRFFSPQGVSTEAQPSAKGVAQLVRQIKAEGIRALFVESIADPRLIEQIGRETGVKPAGRLYSDSLSAADGPAATYEAMMRHNTRQMVDALRAR